jgi:hypothetical protein
VNKKYLSITIILLVMFVLVVGCGTDREISTPLPTATELSTPSPTATKVFTLSTTMVGHWGYFREGQSDPDFERYFGEFDDEGSGSGVMIEGGETVYFIYRILSESEDTLRMSAAEKGDPFPGEFILEVGKNDQSMIIDGQEYQYIDSTTEP